MRRRIIPLALYLSLMSSTVTAHGLEPWMDQILVDASIRHDVFYWKLRDTIHCESMHFSMDVITGKKLGVAREVGAVQLHPRGLLPLFYSRGFDNPYSFTQSVEFLAERMSMNNLRYMQQHWSCYPKGNRPQ